jgi:FkbM family methyltransferase
MSNIKSRAEASQEIEVWKSIRSQIGYVNTGANALAKMEFIEGYADLMIKYYRSAMVFGAPTEKDEIKRKAMVADFIIKFFSNKRPEGKLKIFEYNFPYTKDDAFKYALKYDFLEVLLPHFMNELDPIEKMFLQRTRHGGSYEQGDDGEVNVKKGDVVFDCGAGIGTFSLIAAGKGAKVYAFEAIPSLVKDYLSKTIEMNKTIGRIKADIKAYPVALADKVDKLDFILDPNNIGGATAYLVTGIDNARRLSVECTTLDAFVEQNNIDKVDFIKADIEGAERFMLKGAKNVLKKFAPKLSICVYHTPDEPKAVRDAILSANPDYRIEEKDGKIYAFAPKKLDDAGQPIPPGTPPPAK